MMSETVKKRVRRPVAERAAEIDVKVEALKDSIDEMEQKKMESAALFDQKIAKIQAKIKALQAQKDKMLSPKKERKLRRTKKQKIQEILTQASKSGLKPEEIADRLGVSLSE